MGQKKKIKRIGVLTGGGDCPGLNAVIRAVTAHAIINHNLEVFGILDGYSGLINKKIKKLSLENVSGILPRGGTILGTSNRDNPFKYPSDPKKKKRNILMFRQMLLKPLNIMNWMP